MTILRVPGSSANLGPGFDGVGMAVSLYAEIGSVDTDAIPARAAVADDHHPATIAYRAAGGSGRVWVRSEIPMGRGLGYSGAVRVGGAMQAAIEMGGRIADPATRQHVLDVTARLEGHADNVAASLLGGVVGTNGHLAARLPLGIDLSVVVWSPQSTTSTADSRAKMPTSVAFGDAVFNVTHTALLLAALASGDVDALREATADRLHQDLRLAKAAPSRMALDTMMAAGAIAAWLSGSGPTVACFTQPDEAERIAAALPSDGRARALAIDLEGVRELIV